MSSPDGGFHLRPVTLPDAHGTVLCHRGRFWRTLWAFAGQAISPRLATWTGQLATDLPGGSRYGYTLLSVIMLSNLVAILLQSLAPCLGIASGRDLVQACRDPLRG